MLTRISLLLLACCLQSRIAEAQMEEELGVLSFDSGPPPQRESCPPVRVIPNFNLEGYMGRWFELERFESPFQSGECGTVDYQLRSNGTFAITSSEIVRGNLKTKEGLAVPASGQGVPRFHVTLPGIPEGDGSPNYNVVTTDYRNFAVLYTCVTVGFSKFEFAWIMSRRPHLPPKFTYLLKNWLLNVGIDSRNFVQNNQKNCAHHSALRI